MMPWAVVINILLKRKDRAFLPGAESFCVCGAHGNTQPES